MAGISLLLFVLFFVIVASGQRGGDAFFGNLWLTIPVLAAAISAIGSFLIGITAMFRNEERAVLVFASTVFGFIVMLYVLAEIVIPH